MKTFTILAFFVALPLFGIAQPVMELYDIKTPSATSSTKTTPTSNPAGLLMGAQQNALTATNVATKKQPAAPNSPATPPAATLPTDAKNPTTGTTAYVKEDQ